MKILGIDSSAKSASAAVTENGKILSSFLINTGLTHSETLMPMVENVLRCAKLTLDDINLIAVNNGPGSFTGIRIGVAAVKGMCDALNVPCIAVSTLESMAYNLVDFDCIVCASMDARCSQVYNALFDITDGEITRLTEDTAIPVKDLENMLKKYNKVKICVGDGAKICYNALKINFTDIRIACEMLRYQSAVGVCFAAESKCPSDFITGKELVPYYLRLPQAERELNNKYKK